MIIMYYVAMAGQFTAVAQKYWNKNANHILILYYILNPSINTMKDSR